MIELIILNDIPIPPSSNHQYNSIIVKGRPVRVPAKEFNTYKKQFAEWFFRNKELVTQARETIRIWNSPLEVAMYCCFDHSRLITKDGRCKRLDISNRSKILHDLLSDALQIDDSVFVSTPMEKAIATTNEGVIVKIRPFQFRYCEFIRNLSP